MVLIVREPGGMGRGRRVHQIVQGIDVMPTILELAGVPVPETAQGRSLVPLIRTGQDPAREAIALAACWNQRAIRTARWKLIHDGTGQDRLFDLAMDPREQRDLAQRHPSLVASLRHRLEQSLPWDEMALADPKSWLVQHGDW